MYYTTGFRRDEIQDLVAIVRLIQGDHEVRCFSRSGPQRGSPPGGPE
ncbi:hypothetical protein [Pseudonocardia sp. ICBG1142]|nr:hypothetical protein [Pseudonocardia sp. ICBG1142]